MVGTVAVETSDYISKKLVAAGVPHEVLNAKNHYKEAQIIMNAGQRGAVTIATNMAGRGTDIKLGEGVRELGGLCVIGTERHESRRIDNQLRGRSGRQGDPGESQFYLSLEDDLMKRFGSERLKGIFERLNMSEEAIESRMLTRQVEAAQKRVEEITTIPVNKSFNTMMSCVNNVRLSTLNVTTLSLQIVTWHLKFSL